MRVYPYIKPRFNGTQMVMLDVVIALLPLVFVGWFAYGGLFLQQLGIAVSAALFADFVFSALLLKKYRTVFDGSALVTALLLVFTISPITPWYVVGFGAATAILFGKILWGGLGKNRFNPALVGREFMSVFFASIMTSPIIWKTKDLIKNHTVDVFEGVQTDYITNYLTSLVFQTKGAMGEYSIACMVLGGLYLLFRNRISWHIPFSLLGAFILLNWVGGGDTLQYSMGGILLGTLFMATDMPSSPTTKSGQLYYGLMIGIATYAFIKGGVRYEYMSYSILLMNGFSDQVSVVFKPRAWGVVGDWKGRLEAVFMLSLKIGCAILAVLSLYYYDLIHFLVFIYIVYVVLKFNYSFSNKVNNVV